jgi:crotonobetainyl-CoA:carnitine CoA-transferase CaiB-like acyl-CoA transferase
MTDTSFGADEGRAAAQAQAGPLVGVRVLEIGDEVGEYCGLVLAGLGADVVKVEPVGGSPSRGFEPFYEDVAAPDRSLFFWALNRGKRSIRLDPDSEADAATIRSLVAASDVVLDSTPVGALERIGLGVSDTRRAFPRLIHARITHFGDSGPWSGWKGTDLVHLALGGIAMNCGYDPDPSGDYKLPPIAPQGNHSYAIAGEQMAYSVIAALVYRSTSGDGQTLTCAVHEAVAKNTEGDLMSWIALRTPFLRQTGRHSRPIVTPHWTMSQTLDGRWILAMSRQTKLLEPFLEKYGIGRIAAPGPEASNHAEHPPGTEFGSEDNIVPIQQTIRRYLYDDFPWREAQEAGLMWVPVRDPYENAHDEHWLQRGTFTPIEHPELGKSFLYPTSKWISSSSGWTPGRRAPLLDEDRATILSELAPSVERSAAVATRPRVEATLSAHGKPFALSDLTILDFGWFLASAGATRFLAGLGAQVIKVEWKSNKDPRRGGAPVGGRAARNAATGPVPSAWPPDDDGPVGAQYNNKNPGKLGISLNVRDPRGLELAKQLVIRSDVVTEGFSPGVMERWGLGYEVLRELKPDIIYAKQSGMGEIGTYGRFRTVGQVAAALSGVTQMSGLADPLPPAGWGYSYLDWFGAYSFALAVLSAVYHRNVTGEGQQIDASQSEVGLFLAGAAVLDGEANHRGWTRTGNVSPHQISAPEGIYRTRGHDRWIAISCTTEEEWRALCHVAQRPDWLSAPNLVSLGQRRSHRPELDRLVTDWTSQQDGFELMARLQEAGVPAGVAQTAEDRVERDPQLESLEWLTELVASDFGTWPVAEASVKMSETPPYAGGQIGRGAPIYGEHNYKVYGDLLGLSESEVDQLSSDGVL